jgi:outer membrane lipoprotein-sorting protein
MKRTDLRVNPISSMFAAILILCLNSAAQTVDQIISKNVAARGGLVKIHAIHSMTITGRLLGTDTDFPIVVRLKRPGSFRMDLTIKGKVFTQAFNGSAAWAIDPYASNPEPRSVSGDELNNILDQADFDGALIDYKSKGHKVEFVGKESVADRPCFKLKINLNTGTLMYQYLDASSYLEVREELTRTIDGKENTIEEAVGDYRRAGGVLFPFLYDSNAKGSSEHHRFTVDKIQINVAIDDSVFNVPGKSAQERR